MDPTWTDDDGGAWIVTRYDQVREVQQDYRTFTPTEPPYQLDKPLMPSFFDPPQQTRQRSIILPLMTPEKIEPLEEWHAAIPDYRIADPDKVGFSGGGVLCDEHPAAGVGRLRANSAGFVASSRDCEGTRREAGTEMIRTG